MATLALTPVEEYLRTSYEPDADFVDGVVEERFLGEWDHASWQFALQYWFSQHREWNLRVRPEVRIQVSATRYRVADVVVVDRARPVEQIIRHPPVAVFEVLSPEDRMSRILPKLEDYARMGIQNVFCFDRTNVLNRYMSGVLVPFEQDTDRLHGTEAILDTPAIDALRDL